MPHLSRLLHIIIFLTLAIPTFRAQDLKSFRNYDGKYGFKDAAGNIVIQPKFDNTFDYFSNGLAAVKQHSKWGLIDTSGRFVIQPRFDAIRPFIGEFCEAKLNGDWGYLDKSGNFYHSKKEAELAIGKRNRTKQIEIMKSWPNYLSYHLGSKSDYLKSKGLTVLDENSMKSKVQEEVNAWQQKDEFETTAQWQARVNESTRQAKAQEIAKGFVDNYNHKLTAASAEYDQKFIKLLDEYKAIASNNFAMQPIVLRPYDADNQTFLISTDSYGDILLPVPFADARDFKTNWETTKREVKADFVLVGDNLALKSVSFGKYVYDSNTQANYAQVEADYNFRPVEIPNIDYNFQALTNNGMVQTVTTPESKTIKPKTVEPVKNKVTMGNLADVDINIPAGRGTRENTFALVIANENYSRVSEVQYALNDGRILKQYLLKTLGLPEKNIFTATDASLNDINYNLERIANVCKAYRGDASVIVYYAGHGVPDEDTKDAYLLPVDGYAESPATSGISLKALLSSLESMPTQQMVVFMDACFSGANRNDDMLLAARSVRIKPKEHALTKENMVVISASQGNQTAQPYGEKQHGLFTYFLLKKLGESAGEVTLGELSDYIIRGVERQSAVAGKTQTPSVIVAPGNTEWTRIKL